MPDLMLQNERIYSILRELVRQDSSEKEKAVADYIYDFYYSLGYAPIRQNVSPGRENILVELAPGKPEGKCLLYVGHMDVVPAGDIAFWKYPPFNLTEKDGKFYGRGSCDMKGSLAATMEAAARLRQNPALCGRNRLLLLYDADEERQNTGVQRFLEEALRVDFILVGEPTGCTLGLGHRGVMAFTVTFLGKSAHAASIGEGINAVHAGVFFTGEVEKKNKIFQRKNGLVGCPSIQVTMIQGGTQVNMVPESCILRIDRRLIPGETKEKASREVYLLAEQAAQKTGCGFRVEVTTFCPPCVCRKEEYAKLLWDCMERKQWSVFKATCEAGLLAEKLNAPAAIFGPGEIAMAHKVDEYVEAVQLMEAARVYEAFFQSFLEKGKEK